ncbi:MAG: hydrogenase maturation nickel metallochaperone HypA [Thermogemmatispora sp.]|uniref:hydrogenase maturation nickel metallochaperone HypA n=1 Tax=Thermogemmatispora sp. TaxID=1968838 RepID=UPI00262B218B|nr:hydrogenase maturation nickel metallochaperone HypA [Thermogemmatispora sp.]MBX5458303.1 hydrogenase maturation nickel metallochaperone HypA [Thermogemmatispora sp.]
MHELALAQSIIEVVETRAEECGVRQVRAVHLRVGEASGVLVEALQAAFTMLASLSPVLAEARLAIEVTPHRAWCEPCASSFAVEDFIARCPACGTWSTRILSGTELQILDMEVGADNEQGGQEQENNG